MGSGDSLTGWPVLVEWALVLTCTMLAWRRLAGLRQLNPPDPRRLLRELTRELDSPGSAAPFDASTRRAALAELNQRLSDVAFALGVLPATFTALTRICIASGTALALAGFLQVADRTAVARSAQAAVCALSGFVGAGISAAIGRAAQRRAANLRETWDRASRELGKALRTSLM